MLPMMQPAAGALAMHKLVQKLNETMMSHKSDDRALKQQLQHVKTVILPSFWQIA